MCIRMLSVEFILWQILLSYVLYRYTCFIERFVQGRGHFRNYLSL